MNKQDMSEAELKERLGYFKFRAQSVRGNTLTKNERGELIKVPVSQYCSEYFGDLIKGMEDPKALAEQEAFMAKVAQGDEEAKKQMCAIRIELFNNYLYASQNILDFFFEVVTLKPDERPTFQNTTMNEVSVYYVGQDGEGQMVKVDRDDQYELKNLHFLQSDKARYRVVDIYNGVVRDNALATLRMAYDWKNKAEAQAFTLMTGGTILTPFVFTAGKRQNYPYVANSRINTANLPTTNDITVNGTTANTNFRFAVFDAIVDYCARWDGADPEGDLRPTGRILIPGSDVSGIGKDITPTGQKTTQQGEQILAKGWTQVEYLGVNWVLVPDNTLAPGMCYPEFNRKPGRWFVKPSLDIEKVINTPELDEKNEEERYMKKVVGFEMNSASRRFMARFKYRT